MDRNDWKFRYFNQNIIRDLINEKSKNNSDKRTVIDRSSSIFYTDFFKKKDSNSNFLSINNYEFYISIQSLINVPIIRFYIK